MSAMLRAGILACFACSLVYRWFKVSFYQPCVATIPDCHWWSETLMQDNKRSLEAWSGCKAHKDYSMTLSPNDCGNSSSPKCQDKEMRWHQRLKRENSRKKLGFFVKVASKAANFKAHEETKVALCALENS